MKSFEDASQLYEVEPRGPHAYVYDKYFWSPSGDFLVTAGASVKLWSRRGELLQELDGNALDHAGLSADRRLLALADGSAELAGWTLIGSAVSAVVSAGRILTGRIRPWQTRVWQIESN